MKLSRKQEQEAKKALVYWHMVQRYYDEKNQGLHEESLAAFWTLASLLGKDYTQRLDVNTFGLASDFNKLGLKYWQIKDLQYSVL